MVDIRRLEDELIGRKMKTLAELWESLSDDQLNYIDKTATPRQKLLLERLLNIQKISDFISGEVDLDVILD